MAIDNFTLDMDDDDDYRDDVDGVQLCHEHPKIRKTYQIFADYSEYSTLAGIVFVFKQDISYAGRLIWAICVVAMLGLGIYWSFSLYSGLHIF